MWLGDRLWSHVTRKLLNDWRIEMRLKKIKPFSFPYRYLHGKEIPTLYAFSPIVLSKPHEYSNEKYITGFWINENEENYHPDKKLAHYLNSGDKPIYIGFGGNQPFWGNRVYKLGIEPSPILRKELNVNNFSNAIYQVTQTDK